MSSNDHPKANEFVNAVKENDLEAMKLLLKQHPYGMNDYVYYASTGLLYTTKFGSSEMLQLLVSNPNTRINSRGVNKEHALLEAVFCNKIENVQVLLSHPNIDVNAFRFGCQTGTGFEKQMTPLIAASVRGYTEMVKLLLANPNIDVNAYGDEDHRGRHPNCTALQSACLNNHVEVVELLLARDDIDVNIQNPAVSLMYREEHNYKEFRNSALHFAVTYGHEECVKQLLSHPKIDVNLKDFVGDTPLHNACQKHHEAIIKLLLKHPNIDITIKNSAGFAPNEVKSNSISFFGPPGGPGRGPPRPPGPPGPPSSRRDGGGNTQYVFKELFQEYQGRQDRINKLIAQLVDNEITTTDLVKSFCNLELELEAEKQAHKEAIQNKSLTILSLAEDKETLECELSQMNDVKANLEEALEKLSVELAESQEKLLNVGAEVMLLQGKIAKIELAANPSPESSNSNSAPKSDFELELEKFDKGLCFANDENSQFCYYHLRLKLAQEAVLQATSAKLKDECRVAIQRRAIVNRLYSAAASADNPFHEKFSPLNASDLFQSLCQQLEQVVVQMYDRISTSTIESECEGFLDAIAKVESTQSILVSTFSHQFD